MKTNQSISNKPREVSSRPVVHVSRDSKELSEPIPCNECLNREGRGHGKSQLFSNPSSKYWHKKVCHPTSKSKDDTKRKEDEELIELEKLSELNQRGLL